MGRWMNRLAGLVLTVAAILIAVTAALVLPGNWQLRPVRSGSMAPTVATGSLGVVERVGVDEVGMGDVILFHDPDEPQRLVMHRIVSVTESNGRQEVETKGDANPTKDPWRFSLTGPYAYKLRYAVPYAGHPTMWIRTPATRPLVLTAGSLIAAYAVLQLFLPEQWWRRVRRHQDESPLPEEDSRADASPVG